MTFSILNERIYIEKLVKKNHYSMFYFTNSDLNFSILSNYFFKHKAKSREDIKNLFPFDLKSFLAIRKRRLKYDLCYFLTYVYSKENRQDIVISDSKCVFYIESDDVLCPTASFKASLLSPEFNREIKIIQKKYGVKEKKMRKAVNYAKCEITNKKVTSQEVQEKFLQL